MIIRMENSQIGDDELLELLSWMLDSSIFDLNTVMLKIQFSLLGTILKKWGLLLCICGKMDACFSEILRQQRREREVENGFHYISSIRPQFPFGWNWVFSASDSDVTKIWEAASTWHLPKLLAINRANRDLTSSWIELYVSAKIPTLSAKNPSLKNQSKNLVWPAVSFATCVQKCALHLLGPSITKVNSCWMQTNSTHFTYSFVIF